MKFIIVSLIALLVSSCTPKGTCKNMDTDEKYFVITPIGGLGNRVRAMASAEILAKVSKRVLVIHWMLVAKEMPAQWHQMFENSIRTISQTNLPTECTIEHIRDYREPDDNVMRVYSTFDGTYMDKVTPLPEITIPIVWTEPWLEFRPKDAVLSEADYTNQFQQYIRDLAPIASIRRHADQFFADHGLNNKRVVGVHFRSWTSELDPITLVAKDVSPYDKFVQAMKDELASDPNTVFFLATDDQDIAAKFKVDFPQKIFHREEDVQRITVAGMQSAVVDWVALGKSESIIGTYQSSFSDTASVRTKLKKKLSLGPGMKHVVTF